MTQTDTADRATPSAIPAAKAPVGVGATPLVAQLLALALLGLAVVAGQDVAARTGLVEGDPWTEVAAGALDGTSSGSPWVLVVAVVAVALGLALLPVAFRRRPRTSLELGASTGVRLRRRDLPTMVRSALDGVDGITDARVDAKRRSVRITADTVVRDERRSEVEEDIRARVAPVVDALDRTPRIRIRLKEVSS